MQKITGIFTGMLIFLCISFVPVGRNKPKRINHVPVAARIVAPVSFSLQKECQLLFDSLQLRQLGLSEAALQYAMKGYNYLQSRGRVAKNIISICDFSQSSRNKRLYVIDLESKKLLYNTYVAHGRNSGAEYATSFSNTAESLKSSLGFYITQGTYFGSHGLSLKIEGLEKGFNNNALKRNIVIHGCEYTADPFIKFNSYSGRSFGCPAIPSRQSSGIIQTLKEGSCLFIYHPSASGYLFKSSILNS